MATLFDALSDCSFDLQNKRDLSGDFSKKIISYRDRIVSEFLKYNTNLNDLISGVAKKENLNDDQIQRIIEEVNNQVYLIKYDKLKGQNEREVDFDIASLNKIKDKLKGTSSTEAVSKNEPSKDVIADKKAFENDKNYFEKVASENKSDLFSRSLEYTYGDLSVASRTSMEEYQIKKIAKIVSDKENEIEKLSSEVSHSIFELAETFIHLERLGSDTDNVMSHLMKKANMNENGLSLIKEAITEKIATYVEENYVPETFEVKFENLNTEKTASEKFSLGKYSFNKEACDVSIPSICLSTNKRIASFSDIEKIANKLEEDITNLEDKNNNYIIIREKIASAGIEKFLEEDFFFRKEAGITDSINKLTKLVKSSNMYNTLSGANMTKAQDTMFKSKAKIDRFNKNKNIVKVKENIIDADNKIKNVKKITATEPQAMAYNKARTNVEKIRLENKDALRRSEEQGFIRNLFDRDARTAKNKMNNAKGNLSQSKTEYDNLVKSKTQEFNKMKEDSTDTLNRAKNSTGYKSMASELNETQKAFQKARRNTYGARAGVIAAPIALGAGIHNFNKNKNNNNQNSMNFNNPNNLNDMNP